jgi:hypothetical protein
MADYKVTYSFKDRDYYVRGLKNDVWGDGKTVYEDTLMIGRNEYGEGIGASKDTIHRLLYDLRQTHDGVKDGDRFKTRWGNFKVVGVQVVEDYDRY